MKKIKKSRIFIFILTAIMFTSIGVYAATTYKATDVVYNASNGTSMSVNDALNKLYAKQSNVEPYISNVYVYAYTNRTWNYGRYSSTITIKPNGCKSFTIDTINQKNVAYTITNATETETNKFEPIDSTEDVIITYELGEANNYTFGGNYRIISYEY